MGVTVYSTPSSWVPCIYSVRHMYGVLCFGSVNLSNPAFTQLDTCMDYCVLGMVIYLTPARYVPCIYSVRYTNEYSVLGVLIYYTLKKCVRCIYLVR